MSLATSLGLGSLLPCSGTGQRVGFGYEGSADGRPVTLGGGNTLGGAGALGRVTDSLAGWGKRGGNGGSVSGLAAAGHIPIHFIHCSFEEVSLKL